MWVDFVTKDAEKWVDFVSKCAILAEIDVTIRRVSNVSESRRKTTGRMVENSEM